MMMCSGTCHLVAQFSPSILLQAGNDGSQPQKLKSIDEFNQTQVGGSNAAGEAIAKMYQLRQVHDRSTIHFVDSSITPSHALLPPRHWTRQASPVTFLIVRRSVCPSGSVATIWR